MTKRKVIRAEVLGFCMGVRGALEKVETAAKRLSSDHPVYTYGPLIHNRKVLELLEDRGVGQINSPEEVSRGTVVIRAHGVERRIQDELLSRGIEVIDGTCPLVLKSMKTVNTYTLQGGNVILVGDPNHSEIRALKTYGHNTVVIETEEEARRVPLSEKTMVLAQTTISVEKYARICEILKSRKPDIVLEHSICQATRERQLALKELSRKVQAIVVIGGKNSSNTKRLYELAVASGKPSWHIEEASELPPEITDFTTIGITAGASTPDWCIEEV
jgi:4-hydroxy-3-methylbut-2-enyl diphosphate reductase